MSFNKRILLLLRIYCYLLRKSDNGVYKEHTRSRDACSFIVNDVPEDKLNEFWIYTSNKYGHSKEDGYYLTIGQVKMGVSKTWNGMEYKILPGIWKTWNGYWNGPRYFI